MTAADLISPNPRPRGLATLVWTEALERLGYCGTQLLLTLYLANLLASDDPAGKVAYTVFARVLGPGEPVAMTAQIMALFFAGTHLATLAGAQIALWIDRRKVVALGAVLMIAGHFAVAEPELLPAGLALLMGGAGLTISNKLTLVGLLGWRRDGDRTQGFASYAIGLNAGVLLAPLICGTMGEQVGWAWGFRTAGLSMALGLGCYLLGWRSLPREAAVVRTTTSRSRVGIPPVLGVGVALLSYLVIIAVVNQAYTMVLVWTSESVGRDVAGFTVPVSWLIVVDGISSIVVLFCAKALWRRHISKSVAHQDLTRVALGCAILASAYCWLAVLASGRQPSLFAVVPFFVILELAVAYVDVPIESWLSRSPVSLDGGGNFALLKVSAAGGALLLGWLGQWYRPLAPQGFWLLNAALAVVALIGILAVRRWADRDARVSSARSTLPPPLTAYEHPSSP